MKMLGCALYIIHYLLKNMVLLFKTLGIFSLSITFEEEDPNLMLLVFPKTY
jgi:hypothetical protein